METQFQRDLKNLRFLVGLFGVLGTGLLFGMGNDNWWNLATSYGLSPATGGLLYLLVPFNLAIFDLVGALVVFEGIILVVQRARWKI